jgi:hypothetical protein
LKGVGFEIVSSGYFNMVLFLPTLIARAAQRLWGLDQMEHSTRPTRLHHLLAALFRLELPLLRRGGLPVGTSAFFVGRRPC